MSSVDSAYGGFLPDNYWLGAGLSVGILANYNRFGFESEVKKVYATYSIGSTLSFQTDLQIYLSQNWAFKAGLKYKINKGKNATENIFSLKHYF